MSKAPMKKVRCAIYTRKSSEEGLDMEFNSLDAQRESCEAYIISQRQEGWTALNDYYDDGGVSGGTLDRPALQRLVTDIEIGHVDVVVVYKIDRLSRSLMDFAKLVEVFDRHNVTFVSVTQQFNTTTSMGRLTLNILLSFAQFEREVIGERIRDKFAASRKRGMWMGGNPPLGYDVVNRKLVANKEEAGLVCMIFKRFIKIGSATLLVKDLNAEGYRTKSWTTQSGRHRGGNTFNKGFLYKMLHNRVYLGDAVHKGESFPGEHNAIVDQAVWDKVHSIFSQNARKRGNHTRASTPALLKGLIRCRQHDCAMTPSHTNKKGKRYRYYVCMHATKNGHDTCDVKSVPAGEVENAIVAQVRAMLRSPEIVSRTIEQVKVQGGSDITEAEIIKTLSAIEPVWEELFPVEQARILRLLVEAVDVSMEGLDLKLRGDGLEALITELQGQDSEMEVA